VVAKNDEVSPSAPSKKRFSLEKGEKDMRFLFLVLAFIFFIVWLVSWLAFHIAGGLIHILLVIGVILLVIHFLRGKSSV
jgi:uncharacterized membrane protein (DUF485 family)